MPRVMTPLSRDCDDRAALTRLSLEFRAPLLRYFGKRADNKSDLEDMVQEVLLRLLKRGTIADLEQQNANAYVFETASSVLRDVYRKQAVRHTSFHEPFDAANHSPLDFSPEHILIHREQLDAATALLRNLPERTQLIFLLRRIDGLRYQDIATSMAISVSAVEKHMRRAVLHLMGTTADRR